MNQFVVKVFSEKLRSFRHLLTNSFGEILSLPSKNKCKCKFSSATAEIFFSKNSSNKLKQVKITNMKLKRPEAQYTNKTVMRIGELILNSTKFFPLAY